MTKRITYNILFVLFLVLTELAGAAFDPVNDDTDIFLANPNIAAERPNVLIVLDNTANWNQAFTNEKSALVQVVNNLSDQFNVGLMMFPETGGGNDNVDGGYVRYHVRQMTATNKAALSTLVNNLHILNDKGNNATIGLALYEAYLYYAGLASNASYGKVKTDTDGTTDPLLSPLSGVHALPASPTSSSLFRSPIVDGCQRNFIIYISNGPANENASARSALQTRLETLTGISPPNTITINPSGQQANWADEMSRYMANADVNGSSSGTQNVYTYAVEVNPSTSGQGPDMTALLRSVATSGKGKYFGVTSDASGSAIVDALNAIFTEVQAVNSVFASTTLPVSVNVRGTNLNQVYIGVFRPDPNKAPRWLGNLKMYNLARNSTTGSIYLADATNGAPPATGVPAENSSTGFVTGSASSFWTANSTFWSFRDASQNGLGGSSDKPDGDLVEKGGAAQQIRQDTSVSPPTARTAASRTVYTCTGNCLSDGPGSSLTLFNTSNSDIDAASLNLDTRLVSPLTALASKAVTTLTDRRSASLSNAAAGAVAVTSMSAGNTTRAISSLVTDTPKNVTSLTALGNQSVSISNITKSGSIWTVQAASALPSGFSGTAAVTFSGFSNTAWNNVTLNIVSGSVTSTTFRINPAGNPGNAASGSASVAGSTTTARAYVPSHGYSAGSTVTITGASPSQFNKTTSITLDASDPTNYFTYLITPAASAASIASGFAAIQVSGSTTTATATTTGGSFLASTSISVRGASGAAGSGYNGAKTVITTGTNTFTYSVGGTALANNTNTGVVAWQGSSTTVTASTGTTAHGYTAGITNVTIAGSDVPEYNGTWLVQSTPTATSFTFNITTAVSDNTSTTVTASTGTQATVTVTAANHGFATGDMVVVESSVGGDVHASTSAGFGPIVKINDNQFSYTNSAGAGSSPSGTYTVRPVLASSKAIVTVAAHGYATNDQVYIANATPAGYNGGPFTITKIDDNTFSYPLTGLITPIGANSASGVTVSKQTTTARATSVAHGFTNGSSVSISGATPAAFNGSFNITVVDANTFTYTIASIQGDATGTVLAAQSGASSTERTNLINWIRGEDNFEDENSATPTTDIRSSIHGDVLHSRPAVVNYNRYGSDNDVYIYYGANDGVFHAVKGGYATDGSDPAALKPGQEAWGFIANEFFGDFKRLRNNSPIVSSSFKKNYFMDGPIGVYTKDANSNGKLGDTGDTVNLYVAMRRGGRMLYALDVNTPTTPKFLWKITEATSGFSELGQTWSQPTVVTGLAGITAPVLVFGAGYDPNVEDVTPSSITASSATSVTTAAGTLNRTMGRGIYVVNALTGAKIWSAGRPGSGATKEVTGMDYAIPSDITIIKNESGGNTNRAYVGDTGGNVWRIDFANDPSGAANNLDLTTVTKLASVGGSGAAKRKFLFAPDVVGQSGYDAVLLGSGDREHPFDTTVTNRMYMFKDFGTDAGPVTGTTVADPTILETAMFDASNNCIQDSSACAGGTTSASAAASLSANRTGWYVTLSSGEKVVGTAISIAGTTFFNTNQPSASAGGGTCGSNLGVARQYQVGTADATATTDLNASGGLTGADRSFVHPGGGYLPSPVHVVVQLDGRPVEAVISGIQVTTPSGATLNSRLRRYWYKEVD